jgi:formylglycine-generating enzyme
MDFNQTLGLIRACRDCAAAASRADSNLLMVRSPSHEASLPAKSWLLGLAVIAVASSACDAKRSQPIPLAHATPLASNGPAASARPTSPVAACPREMALVGSACVDRYEAHLVLADTPEVSHPPYERPVPGERYLARSQPGVAPQAYVSRDEAAMSCRRAAKRLCSAREWRAACRGRGRTLYPYGPDEIRGRCNTGKAHLPTILFGVQSTLINAEANYNSPLLDQQPGYLAKTGEYSGCVNDYGVFDMDGNLHEWIADEIWDGRRRAVFMGAFFSSVPEHGPGCQHESRRHSPLYRDYSIGFRCCMDPRPGGRVGSE